MKPSEDESSPRIELAARLDRRSAEAFALTIRRRLRALGYEGASITVKPARDGTPGGPEPPRAPSP